MLLLFPFFWRGGVKIFLTEEINYFVKQFLLMIKEALVSGITNYQPDYH